MLLHCFFVTGAKVRTFQKPTKVLLRFLCVGHDFFEISPPELEQGREMCPCIAGLVAAEEVARVHLFLHIVQLGVVAVGDDGLGLGFEGGEVVHHAAAEEGFAVL